MQAEITPAEYQDGLVKFISIATQPIEQSNIDAARTAHFMEAFSNWATVGSKGDENNPYHNVGNLAPYLQFASNAGDMKLRKNVADFSAALFDLVQSYTKENPNINLAVGIDIEVLEQVLPEWVSNFNHGFKFKQKKFILTQ